MNNFASYLLEDEQDPCVGELLAVKFDTLRALVTLWFQL
jgi:hypothetical protein